MSQVCRTCLEVVQNASQLFSLEINEPPHDTVHIKTKLETCVPELALHRVKNSVICIYCVGALNTAYNFKTKCLQTEMRLSEYMTKETTDSVDLKKFVEGKTKSPKNHTPLTNTKDINIISLLTDNSSNQLQPNEVYVCPICQKSLASNSLLKEHMSCHNEGGFRCGFCDYHSALEFELQEHLKSHNGLGTESPQNEPPYKCSSCDFITMDKTLFKEHRVLHSGEKLYPCNLCNFKTTHSSSLRRHMKIHTGMRPFRCTKCRYGAPDMEALKMHMRTHTGDKPHKCPECLYSASKRIHLKNHMARAHADKLLNPFSSTNGHSESDEVQCAASADPYQVSIDDINNILKDDCDLSNDPPELIEDNEVDGDPYMVTVADLQEILQGKLPAPSLNEADKDEAVIENEELVGQGMANQPVFRCPVCQQPFKFKYLLKKHMSVHARENKPYECTECGYSTLTKSHFQVHMNTHTGGKIYKCEKCPYSTVYWSNMQKHSRVHTGEKPFKCPYCDYKATQQTSVNSHMNIHPEHRPYPCNECPYAADTMVALQKHMEMHAVANHYMEEDDVILVVPEEATA